MMARECELLDRLYGLAKQKWNDATPEQRKAVFSSLLDVARDPPVREDSPSLAPPVEFQEDQAQVGEEDGELWNYEVFPVVTGIVDATPTRLVIDAKQPGKGRRGSCRFRVTPEALRALSEKREQAAYTRLGDAIHEERDKVPRELLEGTGLGGDDWKRVHKKAKK